MYVWFWNTSGLFPPHRWKFATRVRNCPSQFTGTYRQAGRIEREVVHSAVSAWITVPLMKDPIPNFVVPGMVPYCVCLQLAVARNVSCCEKAIFAETLVHLGRIKADLHDVLSSVPQVNPCRNLPFAFRNVSGSRC